MISNERRWPARRPPQYQPQPYQAQPYYDHIRPIRPPSQEDTLESREIQVERKHFLALLKENPRGRFLRISEEANGRSNSIIIPESGLREFQKMLEEMVNASAEIPAKSPLP